MPPLASLRGTGYLKAVKSVKVALLVAAMGLVALAACGKDDKGLRITKLTPKTGPYTGGSEVTIEGEGFASGGATGVKIYFGEKLGRQVVFEGDTKLHVEPPPGKNGESVDVTMIFDDGRKFVVEKAYTYVDLTEGFSVDDLAKDKDEDKDED
jgi:major membrane immunogen (membrane-anchored lipoprotein)